MENILFQRNNFGKYGKVLIVDKENNLKPIHGRYNRKGDVLLSDVNMWDNPSPLLSPWSRLCGLGASPVPTLHCASVYS